MYSVNNSGNLFYDELTILLTDESGFNQYKYKMSVYYKYVPDGSKLVVLYCVYDFVYLGVPTKSTFCEK